MIINRRAALKMFAIAPTFCLLKKPVAHGLLPLVFDDKVYIFLHGMFFMEVDNTQKNFVVATPNYDGHRFYTRLHDQPMLQQMYTDINLVGKLTGGMNPPNFDQQILQFPRFKALGIRDPVLSQASMYRCRMTLPYPEKIWPLRAGCAADFCPHPSSAVGASLSIGKSIATITCLQYSPLRGDKAYTQSYYAEHPHTPRPSEINDALEAAQDLCGDNFDLQITCGAPDVCVDPVASLPPGTDQNDEFELKELLPRKPPCTTRATCTALEPMNLAKQHALHVDVASCPQFGINP